MLVNAGENDVRANHLFSETSLEGMERTMRLHVSYLIIVMSLQSREANTAESNGGCSVK
jgi:hypothetical protein